MKSFGISRSISCVVAIGLVIGILGAACAQQVAAPGKPAKTAPVKKAPAEESTEAKVSGSLAQYYGFDEPEILKLQNGMGKPIVVDINGDGLNDIVIVNNAKARVELLLQKKNFDPSKPVAVKIEDDDVNDVFGREAAWRYVRVSYDLDVRALSLAMADVNGDKLPDLSYLSGEGLHVVLQQAPAKADKTSGPAIPKWQQAKLIDISGGVRNLVAGDINGDGRTDLAMLVRNGMFAVIQKADGTLARPVKHYASGAKLRSLHLMDINNDGRDDAVILTSASRRPLRVRLQTARGVLGPEIRPEMTRPRVFEPGKLGKLSCLFSVSAQSGRVHAWALAPAASKEAHPLFNYPLPDTKEASKRDMLAVDLNGDKLTDIVVSDPTRGEFLVYEADGKTSLGTPQKYPGLTDMQKLCAGDLEGKGRESIVALSIKEKLIAVTRMEKGRLVFPESVKVKGEPVAMDVKDINGDGKYDLVYIGCDKADEEDEDSDDEEDKYFLRTITSLGRKDAKAGPEVQLKKITDKPQDLRIGDIDNDGLQDVMVIPAFGSLHLVRQQAGGKFIPVTATDIHAGLVDNIFPTSMSLAKLGPKGATAILVARKKFARSMVFDVKKGWKVVDQYQSASPQSNIVATAACKIPGQDGLAIITFDSARERLGVLVRQGDGTYMLDKEHRIGAMTVKKILAGNFGGPSGLSIMVCGVNRMIRIPIVGMTHELRKIATYESGVKGAYYGAIAVGDVNSDGLEDIVLVDPAKRYLDILTFDRNASLVSACRFKVFEQPRGGGSSRYGRERQAGQPRAVELGDVTGDGKNDIIMLIHDRIIVYPQD